MTENGNGNENRLAVLRAVGEENGSVSHSDEEVEVGVHGGRLRVRRERDEAAGCDSC